ncbi:MAG: beta-phosphoglucomutase family hydrolase [Candidatus Omnitrophica bacterium]|nr:beta-phosphoglucomutase family hydrolase [Candidatus Omnitrophota bacterium]MBU4473386.1 beta-phosphoglucomutase family hydrolase [Candidatus Omnitrophota bacterium]MCG2706973.1 beta-phosphoglucomutase family hydrolase [Candidatus Omnitrophota bacterium]
MALLKGVIFDLDGVIVNTVPSHFEAWKKLFGEYGKDFAFQEYKEKVDGIPRIDGVRAILKDLPEQELQKAAAKKQGYFLEFLEKDGIKVYNSTVDFIKEAKGHNLKVAVISSSKNCLYILKKAGIDNLFDIIITGNDIKKGKPHPDVFLLAGARLGLEPEECLVFEDAVLGVEAAKRGNFKCVGVDRYQEPRRLSKADLVISDFSEINLEKSKGLFK